MGILQDRIYAHSPIRLQNWLVSLYGIKLYRERYGQYYEQELERLRGAPNEASPDAKLDRLTQRVLSTTLQKTRDYLTLKELRRL